MWRVVVLVFVLALGELAVPSSAAYGQREESEGHCKTNEDCGADSKKYLIHKHDKQDTCSGRCGAGHDPSKTCQCNTYCGTYGDCCADYHALCTQQTCSGKCNAALDNSKPCQCNSACVNFGDCCPDYQTLCVDTCSGRCGAGHDPSKTCQCNTHCGTYGDCCADYHALCTQQTCSGRCNAVLDISKPCQCNSACVNFGDCCPDYQTLCVDGNTPDVTCDISCLANQLWDNDVNRVQVWEYEVNQQGQTTTSSTSDEAAQKLFTYLQEEAVFQKPTYRTFLALLDNYTPSTSQTESQDSGEWVEIDAFLDAILATDIMNHLYNFLVEHGHVTDVASYREVLKELWFNLYARSSSGPINSSGFEHVMVGETSSKVSGFHNWIQFYLEEKKSAIDYQGWVSKNQPLNIVAARFTWNGLSKAKGSFFVGVSPEFDIAIYTACALTRPNASCSFTMAGNSLQIQTYDVAHKTGLQVATAYPNI